MEALLAAWKLEKEYEDLILSSYFYAVYSEIQNVCSEHSPLTQAEQEKRIEKILLDQRLAPYLEDFKKIKEKSPYKLAILSILQNGNGKAAIQIVKLANETKAQTSKIIGFFKKIFKRSF